MLAKEDLKYTDENVSSFLWKMHGNGILSLIFTIIGIYMILFKSPATMKNYKWFLLNITLSILWFEFFIILLYTPFPIFPIPGFCAIGLTSKLGPYWGATVPFWLLCQFLGICGMAVNYAAIFRLTAIYGVADKLSKPIFIFLMILGQLFYSTPTLVSGLIALDDVDKAIMEVIQVRN